MSAGLKQASVIFLPPLIARIFSAPSPSSSAETAQGSQPSAIWATRRREGSVIPPIQIGDPHRIEAERFRLLGHVGDQLRRGILPPVRETDAELHLET